VPAGFLDDAPDRSAAVLRAAGVELPVLGTIAGYEPRPEDRLVCAIGAPRARLAVCDRLAAAGGRFINLVHPTAAIGPGSRLGTGIFMWRFATVSVNVTVGDFVIMNAYASVGHDAVVERGCTLSSHVDITGHVWLEQGVFLGSHASVLPGARVGEFATVGAGSVVLRRVQAGRTVLGVPAKAL
jgi:sugar O-acyltransferase (sialic acid O-acetyltransferase NeuD family)